MNFESGSREQAVSGRHSAGRRAVAQLVEAGLKQQMVNWLVKESFETRKHRIVISDRTCL
jgi:hypothetical protein